MTTGKKYLNIERWKADGLVVCDLTDQRFLKLIYQKQVSKYCGDPKCIRTGFH